MKMKINLVLLLNCFKRWRQDRLVIILMIMGITVGYFTVNIADGYVRYRFSSLSKGNSYNTVTIDLGRWNYNKEILSRFMAEEPLGEAHNALLIAEREGEPLLIGWKGYAIGRWFPLNQEPFFSENDMNSAAKKVYISDLLLPEKTAAYQDVNYQIDGIQFEITASNFISPFNIYMGLKSHSKYSDAGVEIIPYTTFLEHGRAPTILRVDLFYLDHKNLEAVQTTVSQWFADADVVLSPSYATQNAGEVAYIYAVAGLLCLMSLSGIIALFGYWIETNHKQYLVYLLSGASPRRVSFLIVLEWSSLSLIAYGIAVVVQFAFSGVLSRFNILTQFNPGHMAFVYMTGLLISTVFLSGSIVKCARAFSGEFATGGSMI